MAPRTKKVKPTLTVKEYGEAVVEFAKNNDVEREENNSCVIVIYAEEQADGLMNVHTGLHGRVNSIIETLEHILMNTKIDMMQERIKRMLPGIC